MSETTGYLSLPRPRVLAHRGLAVGVPENTLAAFRAAAALGVPYLESDVRATRDGVAVLVHDDGLHRIAGHSVAVDEIDWADLRKVDLGGGARVPSLAEALELMPDSRFNLDVKSEDAIEPMARAIRSVGAQDRVLIGSFSGRRRKGVVAQLPGVAASAAPTEVLLAFLAGLLGVTPLARWALRTVDAVQIPVAAGPLRLGSARSIRAFHRAEVEVHFWTVNDTDEMARLLDNGADGIVTDRADLALALVAGRPEN